MKKNYVKVPVEFMHALSEYLKTKAFCEVAGFYESIKSFQVFADQAPSPDAPKEPKT